MKKWTAVIIVLAVIIVFVFWLIPARTNIHQKLAFPVNTKAFAREILNEEKWQQWWPGQKVNVELHATGFEYNGNRYSFTEKKLSSLVINVSNDKDSILTELLFLPQSNDSIELTWQAFGKRILNPVGRIQNLSWTKKLNSDLSFLLGKIQSFYSNEEHLYGFTIRKELVPDSNLISTSVTSPSYPTTQIIYSLVDRLKNYIQKNAAKELDYPMLNINKNKGNTYLTRVAIPVDKKLEDSGSIQYRWMLQGGNILVTEVRGGPGKIQKAFDALEKYAEDYRRIAPAIPFQSLVTDRRQEPDTSKWITKVYWPVM